VELIVLDARDVHAALDPVALLAELRQGFAALSGGRVVAPPRNQLTVPDGYLLGMPAWTAGRLMTVKLVNVFEGNAGHGLPSHQALLALFDPATGSHVALLDGTFITAIRTAAAAALATELLARDDARVLTILGAGVQGEHHLRLQPLVRPYREILVGSLRLEDAERLAATSPQARAIDRDEVADAVSASDVVCLCSHASEPIIQAAWVRPGTHVGSVGYAPPRGELDPALARRHPLFVETRLAFEAPPVGCAELAGIDPETGTELGEVVLGVRPGRRSPDQVTVYKAMGHAMEDMVAANLAYQTAIRTGRHRAVTI
jgi:ornithine cyclodeaminase/alanine dehydrogenase-like protein (mu-crystallin family)